MEDKELISKVSSLLKVTNENVFLTITDVVQDIKNYCNLKMLPNDLIPFIRKKVEVIINYENEYGNSIVFDAKSIKEGDTSITYNIDENNSKENIYGLSDKDKSYLKLFRRIRR